MKYLDAFHLDHAGYVKPAMPGFDQRFKMVDPFGGEGIWREGEDENLMPTYERIAEAAVKWHGHQVCLDIEHWPVDCWHNGHKDNNTFRETPGAEVNRDRLGAVCKMARHADPSLRVGIFGQLPIERYAAVEHAGEPGWAEHPRVTSWRTDNGLSRRGRSDVTGRITPNGLSACVNDVYPVCYAYDRDLERWKHRTRMVIAEAQTYDKPIIVVLSGMVVNEVLPDRRGHMTGEFMTEQIDFIEDEFSGVVEAAALYGRPYTDAPWWAAMMERVNK